MSQLLMKHYDKKEEGGFTLIELLVVIIIIGILAAIAIPVFLNQRERAWRSAAESDLRNVAIEVESFFTDRLVYPEDQDEFDDEISGDFRWSAGVVQADGETEGAVYEVDEVETGFCLYAFHNRLDDDGVVALYDSQLGGLQTRETAASVDVVADWDCGDDAEE